MDALETFRQEVREWLEANCPESQRKPASREEQVWAGRNQTFPSADAKLWFERMRDKGWTVPDWPKEYGGGGLNDAEAKILKDEMKRLGCRTPLLDIGIWMLGPALLEYGNEAQKQEHIPKIARGEIRWCQGYSEPGAGSDLASLQCKAEDKGDHFLVNGTKIWTTNADKSDWIFCLVRTDPNVKKQEGISFLLIDMESEGVSASPIELISGESEFCQTFFDNVKVPKENLVGELNKGWSVAKALLKHERKLMSEQETPAGTQITPVQAALDYVGTDANGKVANAALRDQLVRHEMKYRALGLTHFRSFEEKMSGAGEGNIPMIMKYVGTECTKEREETLIAMLGTQGLGWEGEGFNQDETLATRGWLFSKALSIAGGSSEVQLNIIAKRVLGLPD
ncbi:alkylation response protein AidB-like acyl-CoA dehydrogenase [Litorivivens lipolytica]|uniref:Alkylation response protein AidB-like acyl-CoA dehydrogenase n=1 Tax=Litorivivens lipolytica TaxID=1524264 RepID=A0A7W4W2J3_9GAMM|nr:acyl-CoA dehydrogenase family protein [Litorivivens lipolytica]MBB3045973.1 alkylation response protein AidB-like acyl-CoA dehydrogenase [Litorivivens lipolytica]